MDNCSAHLADDDASRAAVFVETRFADYFARLAPRSAAMSPLPLEDAIGRKLVGAGAMNARARLRARAPGADVLFEVICRNTPAAPHDLRDVIAEVSNQVVGAVCARIAADEQRFVMEQPKVSVGQGGEGQFLKARCRRQPFGEACFDHRFGRRLCGFEVAIGCRLCVDAGALAVGSDLALDDARDGVIEYF